MTVPSGSVPEDNKELEKENKGRYSLQSGQSTIHGTALWQVQTQESQTMGFYADTGQGGTGNGTVGKHVLFTPGSSIEILGQNLKARGNDTPVFNPAKVILCKHGDIHLEATDGDIFLKAKNIVICAEGGDKQGNIDLKATKNLNLKASSIKVQGEGIGLAASKDMSIVAKGFLETQAGFNAASHSGEISFSGVGQLLSSIGLGGKI